MYGCMHVRMYIRVCICDVSVCVRVPVYVREFIWSHVDAIECILDAISLAVIQIFPFDIFSFDFNFLANILGTLNVLS